MDRLAQSSAASDASGVASQRGSVLGAALFSAVLGLGIFIEVLYLTKDLGWRADLTQEKLYSLSGSTKKVLARLKKPLVIEAYFSQQVPGVYKIDRQKISDMLAEYEALGGGKVKLVYYDPLEDERVREKASRLGIQEAQANDVKDDSIQVVRYYQGLRLRYGGDKQKLLPLVQGANTIESQVTPAIRELVTDRKPKIGIFKRPAPPPNQFTRQASPDYTFLERVLRDRYEIVNVDLTKGQTLAEDLEVLVIVMPKDLTDWEKYCFDQHVMHGGSILLFQEAADYSIDMFQSYMRSQFVVDQPDSKLLWKQQLAAYGIDWTEKLVADLNRSSFAPRVAVVRGPGGGQGIDQRPMPYWFNAMAVQWNRFASQLASDPATAATLAKSLGAGIDPKHAVTMGMKRLSFFWPTEVKLAKNLPEGIEGKVLMRTSPLALSETPPQASDPGQVLPALFARQRKEKRQQAVLMSVVKGKFTSAWKGKDMPKRPLPEKKEDKNGGLLTQDPPAPKGKQDKTSDAGKASPKSDAPKSDSAPVQGPKPAKSDAKKAEDDKDKLPPRLDVGTKEARILAVGDSSLIRDDFLRGIGQFRMPQCVGGIEFFQNAIDWLALDTDLIELRNKREVDRKLEFVAMDPNSKESFEERKARIAAKKKFYRWLNILGPTVVLLGLGLFLYWKRSAEKRNFLANLARGA